MYVIIYDLNLLFCFNDLVLLFSHQQACLFSQEYISLLSSNLATRKFVFNFLSSEGGKNLIRIKLGSTFSELARRAGKNVSLSIVTSVTES